jgi:hypothetical protein
MKFGQSKEGLCPASALIMIRQMFAPWSAKGASTSLWKRTNFPPLRLIVWVKKTRIDLAQSRSKVSSRQ